MAVNKVEYGDTTLIDLTSDTVTKETLLIGATAHTASGESISGEFDTEIYLRKSGGDTTNNIVTFTSGDSPSPTAWTNVDSLVTGEKHSSLLNKISTMIKNVRFLYKVLGTTDISTIGDGTVTGAVSTLNSSLPIFSVHEFKGITTFYGNILLDKTLDDGYIISAYLEGFKDNVYMAIPYVAKDNNWGVSIRRSDGVDPNMNVTIKYMMIKTQ